MKYIENSTIWNLFLEVIEFVLTETISHILYFWGKFCRRYMLNQRRQAPSEKRIMVVGAGELVK